MSRQDSWNTMNVFHKLGSIPTCLACPVVVLPCFACLVFRTIANPFKATKTSGALNVIGGLQPISRATDNNAAMYNCWWTNRRSWLEIFCFFFSTNIAARDVTWKPPIRTMFRWRQDKRNWELVGPRPYRVNTIENGRHVNEGIMHRITTRSGPCGNKMGSSRTRGW